MPVGTITKRAVDGLEPGAFLWDDRLSGFGAKVTTKGMTYLVQYRTGGRGSPTRRYTIGRHGSPWTPETARKEAQRVLADVAKGHDPGAVKQEDRRSLTVAAVVQAFLSEHVETKRKQRTGDEYRRLLDKHVLPALGRKRMRDLVRSDVARLHHDMRTTPYQANRVLAVLSKLCSWAEAHGYVPDGANPCRHVEKYKEKGRERFLSPRELGRLGRALTAADRGGVLTPWMTAAVRLLVFTGARLNEILTLRWDWVDLERMVLELPDSKTGKKTIRLNAPACDVLAGLPRLKGNPFVIVGRRDGRHLINLEKPWRRLRKASLLPDVRLHDLRHSHASVAAASGISLPLIGALLGHRQVSTTARYAHLGDDPLRVASESIGSRINEAMTYTETQRPISKVAGGKSRALHLLTGSEKNI